MRSMFLGLEIGRRAVMAHQTALDVTGHNVANANTPGYTRQEAVMVTTPSYHAPAMRQDLSAGQIGTGVTIDEIRRLRDDFVDFQIRDENRTQGYWQSLEMALDKIEVILNEPTDQGLRGVLDNFWKSWQALSESPENESVRAVVLQRGMAVADTFHHIYRQLQELKEDLNAQVKAKVDEINSLAAQLADLNQQIQAITIAGKEPNDLKDRRDLLLDQLSKIVDATITQERNGMVTVLIGGTPLVQGIDNASLEVKPDTGGIFNVVWQGSNHQLSLRSGELMGLLDARGPSAGSSLGEARAIVPRLMDELNLMAKTVVMTTNAVHRGGYSLNNINGAYPDGLNFFDQPGSNDNDPGIEWARYIKVSDAIAGDVKNIAAAGHRTLDAAGQRINFGDGANALKLAQLKHTLNRDEYYAQVSDLNTVLGGAEPFPLNAAIDFTVEYPTGTTTTINIPAPGAGNEYQDLDEYIGAIQQNLTAAGLPVSVRAEGTTLVFYSGDPDFAGVNFAATGAVGIQPRTMIKQATVDDYWRAQVSSIGVVAQEATRMVDNQETLLSQLENKRQSTAGVSLDEEMVNMIRFQHAYNAAARYITTIDEAIEVIVNRMGLVGR